MPNPFRLGGPVRDQLSALTAASQSGKAPQPGRAAMEAKIAELVAEEIRRVRSQQQAHKHKHDPVLVAAFEQTLGEQRQEALRAGFRDYMAEARRQSEADRLRKQAHIQDPLADLRRFLERGPRQ